MTNDGPIPAATPTPGWLDGVTLIGHRGDPEHHPDNTLDGFVSAEAAGADMVELDLRMTADGVLVTYHDAKVRLDGGPEVALATLTHEQLRAALGDPRQAPRFEDVLAATHGPLMVDVKDRAAATAAAAMTEGHRDRLVLAGSAPDLLVARRALDGAQVALSWEAVTYPEGLLDELGAAWYNPAWWVVRPETVARAHQDGRRVSVWTVDHPEIGVALVEAGVDALISNRLGALRHSAEAR